MSDSPLSSSSNALVRVYPGRPPWIQHDGGWVCLSLHDGTYLRERSGWRATLKVGATHSPALFTKQIRRYQQWQRAAQVLYRTWGIDPPSGLLIDAPRASRRGPYTDWSSTHCRNGHRLTPLTIYIQPNGQRRCRLCLGSRVSKAPLQLLLDAIGLVRVDGQAFRRLSPERQVALFQQFADWLESR